MFTVETEYDCTVVTTIDEGGYLDDVEVTMDESTVFIRQNLPKSDRAQVLELSYQQWLDILVAMDLPDGAYYQSEKRQLL